MPDHLSKLTGILLAGGHSSRMGRNKALLPIGKQMLIERVLDRLMQICSTCVIVSREPHFYEELLKPQDNYEIRFVKDHIEGLGPLGGVEAGFAATLTDYATVVACDMPEISTELIEHCVRLLEEGPYDLAWVEGQPLHAVYRVRASRAAALQCINSNILSLHRFSSKLRDVKVEWNDQKQFLNLNTPDDYQEYLSNEGDEIHGGSHLFSSRSTRDHSEASLQTF